MKRFYHLVVAALLAAPTFAAPAESESSAVRVTLAEAIAMARAYSPRVKSLQSLESASEAQLRGAKAGRLPSVDVGGGYTRMSDVPEMVIYAPGEPPETIFPNIPDNYRARIGVTMPIYTGGRTKAQIDASAGGLQAAGHDLNAGDADIVLETSEAYWRLLTAHERVRVLAEALKAYDAHLADARNREAFGMAARSEVLAVQVDRDSAELRHLEASSFADVTAANLARLLGTTPGRAIEPSDPLEPVAVPEIDLEGLVAEAKAKRPERAALVARVSAAEAAVRIERAGKLPHVNVLAGYDYANPNRDIMPFSEVWRGTWEVGLNVSLNLFDGGRVSSAVSQAAAQADAVRRNLEELDDSIRLDVTARVLTVRTEEKAAEFAERNLVSARENQRVTAERYREGVSPSSELLDAEAALLRAGLDRMEAIERERIALARLDRAVGR